MKVKVCNNKECAWWDEEENHDNNCALLKKIEKCGQAIITEVESSSSASNIIRRKEYEKCKNFLISNGWERVDSNDEFECFSKYCCVSVDINENEMVYCDEDGDFFHSQIDYYKMIGSLLEMRQIHAGYKSV